MTTAWTRLARRAASVVSVRNLPPLVSALAVEALALLVSIALAFVVVVHLLGSQRSELLFTDGDSVLPALIRGSLAVGQPFDWSMSSVLFVPESVLYLTISGMNLSRHAAFAVNAVINLVLLFGSFRVLASPLCCDQKPWRRCATALAPAASFSLLCLLENTADRNGLELASLVTTTTYYAPTLIGTVLLVACALSMLRKQSGSTFRRFALTALILITCISTWNNPIFIAWGVVPIAAITSMMLLMPGPERVSRKTVVALLVSMTSAAGVALALRVPVRSFIAVDGVSYIRPTMADESARYYGALLSARLQDISGAIEISFLAALMVGSAIAMRHARRSGDQLGTFLALTGVMLPPLVTFGAIACGTEAARYLQPVFLAAILGVMAWVRYLPLVGRSGIWRRSRQIALSTTAILIILGAVIKAPQFFQYANSMDPSIVRLDRWIEATDRVGAGQYWTIRGPKAYLNDPRQLVQIDGAGAAYDWLVNDNDFNVRGYSFIVADAAAPVPSVPSGTPSPKRLHFGRYTVFDYGLHVISFQGIHH